MSEQESILQIEILAGGEVVEELELSDDKIKVGKLATSQVHLDDPNVSRIHAVLERKGGGRYQAIDLGSASGTYVNGKKITKATVGDGDEIQFGDTVVRLRVVDPAQLQAASAQAGAAHQAGAAQAAAGQSPAYAAADAPVPEGHIRLEDGTVVEPYTLEGYYDDAGNYIPGYYDETGAYHYGYGYTDDDGSWQVAHGFYDPDGEWIPTETPEEERPSDTELYTQNFFYGQPGHTLEIAYLWSDSVLSVESFQEPRSVSIGGHDDNDYVLEDPSIGQPKFPLVVYDEGGGYRMCFTPQMQGTVQRQDRHLSLDEMIEKGLANESYQAAGGYEITLTHDMSVRLDFGRNTFLVHFAPVPALPAGAAFGVERTPFVYQGISLGVHIAFMLLVFMLPDGYGGLELFDHSAQDRFADLAMPPEEEEEEEDLAEDWLEDAMDEAESPDPEEVEDVEEPTVEGDDDVEDTEMQQARDREIARDAGALAVFQGDPQEAIGGDALTALADLDSEHVGSGVGGLGLAGAGRGGAEGAEGMGRAAVGTGGMGGGGGGGDGMSGEPDFEERQLDPEVIPGEPETQGALDREIIQRVVRQNRRQIRHCYQQELQRNPDLAGRITMQWTIAPTGQVVSASVQSTTMNNANVERCMAQRIQRWSFPEPEGGGVVRVNYPFNFSS